jgi:hypothetical protein
LDRWGKRRHQRDSIPSLSNLLGVVVPNFNTNGDNFAGKVLQNLALAVISLYIIIIIIIIIIIRIGCTWRNSQTAEKIRPDMFCEQVLNFRTLQNRIQLFEYSIRRTF